MVLYATQRGQSAFKHESSYQERFFKRKHLTTWSQSKSPSNKKARAPSPRWHDPFSLNLKIGFIEGNPWLGGFFFLQLAPPGAEDHMRRTGTDKEKWLPSQQNRKASTLLHGQWGEKKPLISSSCALHLPTTLWRPDSSPTARLGGTRRYVIREKLSSRRQISWFVWLI